MRRAALTGGIATGKSYCLSRFAALGAATVDADRLAREAVAPGSEGLARVIERFGASYLLPDGSLDRAALGRLVFSDRTARAHLEAFLNSPAKADAANIEHARKALADLGVPSESVTEYET